MNLMPLANLVEDEGLGVKGTTLFIDMLPAEAAQAILLRNPLTGTVIDHELPGYFQTQFQLIVRAPAANYGQGEALINAVIERLTISAKTQVEDHCFSYCRPHTEPVVFPLSKGNLLEFNVMFDCCFVKG